MNKFGSASRCNCLLRARCEYHHCHKPADWSVLTLPYRIVKTWPHGRLHFMCNDCKIYYMDACSKPLKGIDRPENADEDWRPSLMEHLRFARIEMEHEDRLARERGLIASSSNPRERESRTPAPIPLHKQDPAWLAKVERMFSLVPSSRTRP